MMLQKKGKILFLLISTMLICSNTLLATTFKVALLAPEGTSWAKGMKALQEEVASKTNGRVKFKIYFGGSQGDEADVLRKIRVGQLHGGVFTGKTLGDISGDVRVLELPFTFGHDDKFFHKTLTELTPYFNQKISQAKFINLGFFELGKVYFISKKKVVNLEQLKGVKIWSWEGDPLVEAMVKGLNLVSVPLSLPDVLSSLQTGIVEAAYAPPLGILAFQWHTKVKYILNYPLSFATGAFLIGQKNWKKLNKKDRKVVLDTAQKHIAQINKKNLQDNKEAMEAMQALGLELVEFSKDDLAKTPEVRSKIIQNVKGKVFDVETFKRFTKVIGK